MKFEVKFKNTRYKEITSEIGKPGIDLLDEIRSVKPDLKNVHAEDIKVINHCPIYNKHIIYLSENTARKTGLFQGRSEVIVYIPEDSFNRFIDFKFKYFYFDKTFKEKILFRDNELKFVEVEFIINDYKILKEWAEAGFPTKWSI